MDCIFEIVDVVIVFLTFGSCRSFYFPDSFWKFEFHCKFPALRSIIFCWFGPFYLIFLESIKEFEYFFQQIDPFFVAFE